MPDCDSILPYVKPGWVGVEIGVAEGNSALAFVLRGVRFLYLVDPWGTSPFYHDPLGQAKHEECRRQLAPYDKGHEFAWLHMPSAEAAAFIPDVDFVFVDGDHRYEWVKSDLELYWPKIKFGGVLCGHDYTNTETCQVQRAVDEFVAAHGLSLTRFPDVSSCWLVQR